MKNKKKSLFHIHKGNMLPLGVSKFGKWINFSIYLPNVDRVKLNIYKKREVTLYESIVLTKEYKSGNIFCVLIEDFDVTQYEYMYEVMEKEFVDPYARAISGREVWGICLTKEEKKLVRGTFLIDDFYWGEDKPLTIPYSDLILYRLHIRGFTKHKTSKVEHKGTYLGLVEKIPYLKELGINAVELLPVYEFDEILPRYLDTLQNYQNKNHEYYVNYKIMSNSNNYDPLANMTNSQNKEVNNTKDYRINYWGYTGIANYFMPKESYASNPENASYEFKKMVQSLHENGMEVILDMFFKEKTNQNLIVDCLRHWVMEYHIDGFKINDNVVPSYFIATDPILSSVKLFATSWNVDAIYENEFIPDYKNLAEYNDGFLVDIRKFLKSDEEQVNKFLYRFKRNPQKHAVINYITNTNGFTLMDLVSYDIKHNEANEENNKDGTEYNYSWNCGIEGKTKKKKIKALRNCQIKNAFTFLLLSQGTPLILAGDEFCNSQDGNNNAYCQDNQITWLNWNQMETNKEILEYVKQLIYLRKEHPILHKEDELRGMDYIACGTPDISYHGTKAWYPDFSNYSRVLGILLSGKYAKVGRIKDDNYFYIAYNMHWEDHDFDLPILPNGMSWRVLINTAMEMSFKPVDIETYAAQKNIQQLMEKEKMNQTEDKAKNEDKVKNEVKILIEDTKKKKSMQRKYKVKARSIVVFIQDNK